MKQQKNILFVHLGESSFVKEDLRILKKFADLSVFFFKPSSSPLKLAGNFIRQFFWLLNNTHKADAIYCWFSDYHAFLPAVFARIFKKPLLTVLGGFDCNKIEEFNYGIFCSTWRAPLGKYVIRNSTLLLPVDETLIKTKKISSGWPSAHPNGLKNNIPDFETPWVELPTGYNPDIWHYKSFKRAKRIITVGYINSIRTAYIKGVDLIIESAKLLPEFNFEVIGVSQSMQSTLKEKFKPSENIKFLPSLPRLDLKEIYENASVYIQPSRTEGLPNVLCEAMLCGCVPVGSPVFGIPKAVGDIGFMAKHPEPKEIVKLVKLAHQNAKELRPKARQRIIDNFSLQQREDSLRDILQRF